MVIMDSLVYKKVLSDFLVIKCRINMDMNAFICQINKQRTEVSVGIATDPTFINYMNIAVMVRQFR